MLGSMRNRWTRWLLPLAALWLMGMGGGTDNGSGSNIPIPQENFTVTVADRGGQSLQARRFTWEGKVQFRAQLGHATVTLPFSKVQRVQLLSAATDNNPATLQAKITLRSGDTVEVSLDRASKCYGETRYGNYEIFLKDVASIDFQ